MANGDPNVRTRPLNRSLSDATYHTEYGTQTAHIAIDGPSVAALIGVLQRALIKEQTLIEQRAYDFLGKPKDAKH